MDRRTDRHPNTLYRITNGYTDRYLLLCKEILTDRRKDRHPNTLYRITKGKTDRQYYATLYINTNEQTDIQTSLYFGLCLYVYGISDFVVIWD